MFSFYTSGLAWFTNIPDKNITAVCHASVLPKTVSQLADILSFNVMSNVLVFFENPVTVYIVYKYLFESF